MPKSTSRRTITFWALIRSRILPRTIERNWRLEGASVELEVIQADTEMVRVHGFDPDISELDGSEMFV